jgi:alpha-ketoglutarate-dependent sulfate ester dioxygenase
VTDSVLGTSRRGEPLMISPNRQHVDVVAAFDEPTSLRVRPVAGRIGAEVVGADIGGNLDDEVVAAIAAALVDHKVLFFRGQHLDPASHVAFARRFGTLTLGHPTVPALEGHPNVFELDAAKGARANVWHTDVTFVDRPPAASILNAVTIPPFGGDTVWANTEAAYLDLPDHLRSLADQLWARHSNTSDYGSITTAGSSYTAAFLSNQFEARHPVVRVHPMSGRPSLLLGGFARRIEGLSAQESADLIRTFQTYVTRPENTVRWRWQTGDVAMWDNQSTQHYAIDDFGDQPRRVQRVTLVGDPVRSLGGVAGESVTGDAAAYLTLG